ncbi:kinase-like domain-containing protein [Halteromyces radiatus]|uniref:kinase-like domain-containing protein n=1 Tax=Halteromyces radiatus TaxID=101107 RepID=UPI0022206D19|nr:kinase-like domain-containing protein [Halteromyces radiatus]KAI8089890.1 kinase-like domain-containing protein [Halteromyces radiatus]
MVAQTQSDYWAQTSLSMVDKVIDNDYQLLEELGHGSYGCLFLGQSLTDNTYVAIKVLSKLGLDNQQLELQQLEIDIQASLKHPYLLGLERVIHEKNHVFMVMELCDQGDLFDFVVQQDKSDENVVKSSFIQILEAVEHMHAQGVYHRDLKLENVLLKSDNHDDDCSTFTCKVADFGLATRERYSLEFGCGSTTYLAPEHFDDDHHTTTTTSTKATDGDTTELVPYDAAASDVWSVGILLLAFLFGRNPWQEATSMDPSFVEYRRDPSILKNQLFPTLSPACAQFLQNVLTVDGADRPSITQVKEQFLKLDRLLINDEDDDDDLLDDEDWYLDARLPVDIPIVPKSSNKASFDSAIFSAGVVSLTSSGMSWSDMVEEDFQKADSHGYSSLSSSIIEEEDEQEDYDDTDMFVHSQEKGSWWL